MTDIVIETKEAPKGFTAGQMRKQARDAERGYRNGKPSAPPRDYNSYNLTENGELVHKYLPFKAVVALCPGIGANTLRKRLERGVLAIEDLRRKPMTPSQNYAKNRKPWNP